MVDSASGIKDAVYETETDTYRSLIYDFRVSRHLIDEFVKKGRTPDGAFEMALHSWKVGHGDYARRTDANSGSYGYTGVGPVQPGMWEAKRSVDELEQEKLIAEIEGKLKDHTAKARAWNEVVETWKACQGYDREEAAEILYDLVEELITKKVSG